jgi:hypothetical protein
MSATYTPHRWGCAECEYERLRKWAIDNGLIERHTGPASMVDNIIRLTERMEHRIQQQTGQIDALRSRMFQRVGADRIRADDVE